MTAANTVPQLVRSWGFTPGSNLDFMEKAAKSPADVVVLDIEDAVAPNRKEVAADNIVKALNSGAFDDRTVCVRVNGMTPNVAMNSSNKPVDYLGTETWPGRANFGRDELAKLIRGAGDKISVIMLPMLQGPQDIIEADKLVGELEAQRSLAKGTIKFAGLIEQASGLMQVNDIARALKETGRGHSLHFGSKDWQANMNIRPERLTPEELTNLYKDCMFRVSQAARAYGMHFIDGPFTMLRDGGAYKEQIRIARGYGASGIWCLTPKDQIELANSNMLPTERELQRAQMILGLQTSAHAEGKGAFMFTDPEKLADTLIKAFEVLVEHREQVLIAIDALGFPARAEASIKGTKLEALNLAPLLDVVKNHSAHPDAVTLERLTSLVTRSEEMADPAVQKIGGEDLRLMAALAEGGRVPSGTTAAVAGAPAQTKEIA